jgi:hypothetical protein
VVIKFPTFKVTFDDMAQALAAASKKPVIGVTQGGSSRDDRGAKVAATDGLEHPTKKPRSF